MKKFLEKIKFKNFKITLTLFFILIIGAVFRFYNLDKLPADIFGDISQNLGHIDSLMHGNFRILYGYDGREAMIFFIAGFFAKLLGNTYLTLKITCATIGLAVIIGEYFLVKEIAGNRTGLIAAFFVAVSKWSVVFSRIGFRVILTPLFVSLVLYFFIKANKIGKIKYYVVTGVLLGLGLYTYPAFRFMILSIALISLFNIFKKKYVKGHLTLLACVILLCIPMAVDYFSNQVQYSSHINQMLFRNGTIRSDWVLILIQNIKNQLFMFVKGDVAFRVNPPSQPLMDSVSSIFLGIGLIYYLVEKKFKRKIFIFVPFLLLQLPSILVLNNPIDIPSATRTLACIPIIFMFSALGLNFIYEILVKTKKIFAELFLILILIFIALVNWGNYFYVYSYYLPNHNVSFAKIIAAKVDELPNDVGVIMVDSGWGDWGQPEIMGVLYFLNKHKNISFIDIKDLKVFNDKNKKYIICPPNKVNLIKPLVNDPQTNEIEYISEYGQAIFTALKNF